MLANFPFQPSRGRAAKTIERFLFSRSDATRSAETQAVVELIFICYSSDSMLSAVRGSRRRRLDSDRVEETDDRYSNREQSRGRGQDRVLDRQRRRRNSASSNKGGQVHVTHAISEYRLRSAIADFRGEFPPHRFLLRY